MQFYDDRLVYNVFRDDGKNDVIKDDDPLDGIRIAGQMKGYHLRQSQLDLAMAIYHSYESGTNLLADAPTGIGKSIAGLVPAAIDAIYNKRKTVIATTTKALQDQYFNKDLPFLKKTFRDNFSYAMLKGRGNYLCVRRFKSYELEMDSQLKSSGIYDLTTRTQYDWLKDWKTNTGDFDSLTYELTPELKMNINCSSDDCDGKDCAYKDECYFNRQKKKAKETDILLVNMDLFCIDLVLRNKEYISILPNYHSVIIDEAHEFENIFSKYTGYTFSIYVIKNAIAFLMKYMSRLYDTAMDADTRSDVGNTREKIGEMCDNAMKVAKSFFNHFEQLDETADVIRLKSSDFNDAVEISVHKLLDELDNVRKELPSASRISLDKSVRKMFDNVVKRLDSVITDVGKLMEICKKGIDSNYVYWVTFSKRNDAIIECRPIDVSGILEDWLFKRIDVDGWDEEYDALMSEDDAPVRLPVRNVVLMSATLATNKNFDFIRRRLGVVDDAEIILPHAFDYRHNALLYLPKGLPEPNVSANGESFTRLLAKNIVMLSDITEGKMLCLFTSYSEMKKVYQICYPQLISSYQLFYQGQHPKAELSRMFSEDVNSILFATSSFWTGVDFQGDTLSALVIDRIPFPVPTDPLIEARIDNIKRRGGNWFNDYYIPMATMDMCQGFGRLIRTKNDMGIVMLCDVRLITKQYGGQILNSFPDTLTTRKYEKVKVFYDVVKRRREILNAKQNRVEMPIL